MTRVLVIGGYGTFGIRLVRLLSDVEGLTVFVGGRSADRARAAIADIDGPAALVPTELDRNDPATFPVADIVVDVAGPFQAYADAPLAVLEHCASVGATYIDLSDDPDLARARRLLFTWDFSADNIGRADSLALLLIREFMSSEYQNKPEPDPHEELEKAVDHLMTHFGRIDPPMGDLLRLRQGDVDLPLDGGSDTLRASTLWDVDEDGRLSVRHGDSFIQWVEWNAGERVTSRSIQPFGSATTRPDSPHYADQSTLFVQHRLKPVHFWREDVLKNGKSRKTVTNRR